jgi:prepilin-type N-terminal cleavage/methylation domain-containing protein
MRCLVKGSSITHPDQRGFTLVEALIAATLLAVLFLAVAQASARASDAFDEGSAEHALSTTTHRGLERITQAIQFASGAILADLGDPDLGDDDVTFSVPRGWTGTAVDWSGPIRIFAELEPGELDDGQDNDGDGLVDELRVVQVENEGQPDELRTVLASGVAELFEGESANNVDDNGNGLIDERGLSLSATGNVVTVRLACQRRDEAGRLLGKTAETAVRLRNTGGV